MIFLGILSPLVMSCKVAKILYSSSISDFNIDSSSRSLAFCRVKLASSSLNFLSSSSLPSTPDNSFILLDIAFNCWLILISSSEDFFICSDFSLTVLALASFVNLIFSVNSFLEKSKPVSFLKYSTIISISAPISFKSANTSKIKSVCLFIFW